MTFIISRVISHQLRLMWLNKSLLYHILKSSFHAPDTLGCTWIAWHRLHPERKVSFPWGCTESPPNYPCSEKSPSIPGLWPHNHGNRSSIKDVHTDEERKASEEDKCTVYALLSTTLRWMHCWVETNRPSSLASSDFTWSGTPIY